MAGGPFAENETHVQNRKPIVLATMASHQFCAYTQPSRDSDYRFRIPPSLASLISRQLRLTGESDRGVVHWIE
jgi:hypothetical protein